mgnify:FL=1
MALQAFDIERLKREGVAADTIRQALLPVIERDFEQALLRLDQAKSYEELLDARADLRAIRTIMRQLDHKYRLSKE